MAEYLGPSTDNEARVISTATGGHHVPDTYATGEDNPDKFGDPHSQFIDNSLDIYRGETPEGWNTRK